LGAFLCRTFAANTQQQLFHKMAPAGGVGLRVKMDKRARVNIMVDIAFGTKNGSGLYFNLQVAF
jgi:hypothetical protein